MFRDVLDLYRKTKRPEVGIPEELQKLDKPGATTMALRLTQNEQFKELFAQFLAGTIDETALRRRMTELDVEVEVQDVVIRELTGQTPPPPEFSTA